jgi:hypothetical protein
VTLSDVQLAQLGRRIGELRSRVASETDCAKAVGLVAMADTLEETMANAGYRGNTEALRPINEVRFEARWKLGRMLAKAEKRQTVGLKRGSSPLSRAETTGFRAYLREIGLDKSRANECERIGAIPEPKLRAAFEEKAPLPNQPPLAPPAPKPGR